MVKENFELSPVEVSAKIEDVSLDLCIQQGQEIRASKDNDNWRMGDLADMVSVNFKVEGLKEFAKGVGINIGTIRRYRDVARAYKPVERDEFAFLPWSAFRLVAAMPDRIHFLKRAHDENWTVEKLAIMIKPKVDGKPPIDDGLPVPPKPDMDFCPGCRKWYIKNEKDICPSRGQCLETK